MRRWAFPVLLTLLTGAGPLAAQTVDTGADRAGLNVRREGGFTLVEHRVWTGYGHVSPPSALPQDAAPTLDPVAGAACDFTIASMPGVSRATIVRREIYGRAVRIAECRHGLPVGLLDSLIVRESRYRLIAQSPKGALGLTQLMPRTAADLHVRDRLDPVANIEGGARYLRSMLDHFRSVPLALAAYNAGPGAVTRAGGIPFNGETPGYVVDILRRWNALGTGKFSTPVILTDGPAASILHIDFAGQAN